ncbi:hypothetical protein N0V83_003460 [Neocucurbitaria cava]|uniref:Uncharacterized protein n=1 Tax=Neocucurbitaria cava TaxID=798079 RepID=A0A9W9CNP1_9PLEO|nr:hypothetical protein N0V83_003460 [Neocucurbitaria cava]
MSSSHHSTSKKTRKSRPARETVTYPRVTVNAFNLDSCLNPLAAREHILSCGHIIITQKPNEPCAPNCHHVVTDSSLLSSSPSTNTGKKGNRHHLSKKRFYCDACVEQPVEVLIPSGATTTEAEAARKQHREKEAQRRGKVTRYRKCYVGYKVVSVRCDENGEPVESWRPRKKHHPFDTAVPQSGDNMFEDMDVEAGDDGGAGKDTEGEKVEKAGVMEKRGGVKGGVKRKRMVEDEVEGDAVEDGRSGGRVLRSPKVRRVGGRAKK